MRFENPAQNFKPSDAIAAHGDRRICFVPSRFAGRIARVAARGKGGKPVVRAGLAEVTGEG